MEAGRDDLCPANGDGRRQESIGRPNPGEHRPVDRCIKMHNLPQCMYPGIGSASTNYPNRSLGELTQRILQYVLNGSAPGLLLPAAETAPVVLHS